MRWAILLVLAIGAIGPAVAEDKDEKKLGWFNASEFGLAITQGNSDTDSLTFVNTLTRVWEKGRFRNRLNGQRTNTADDRFRQLEAGLVFAVGDAPPVDAPSTLIDPPKEPDIERYFAEFRYDREYGKTRTWNVGGSWDRNEDAGILNRTILFAGVGNVWWDKERSRLDSSYGLSYTDREEEQPDPEKNPRFGGARLTGHYRQDLGKVTTFEGDITGNVSLADTSDYSLDMTNSFDVKMSDFLSLKVSLGFQFNSIPALEDIDLVARVDLIDPDGIPSSGDEFFVTVDDGGTEVELSEVRERREQLDTVFRTTLVIRFPKKKKDEGS